MTVSDTAAFVLVVCITLNLDVLALCSCQFGEDSNSVRLQLDTERCFELNANINMLTLTMLV